MSSDHEEDDVNIEEEEEKKVQDIRNIDVVTKFRTAADIANAALDLVIKSCVADAAIVDLCKAGDEYITEACSKIYNKGKAKISKGIGFPTCISVNNVLACFSPLATDSATLQDGDLVKIELGVQIDGFASQVAHTIVVGNGPVTGRKADAIAAVNSAAQCVQRMLKPGMKNTEITEIIQKAVEQYDCHTIEGVYSHQVTQFEIEDPEKKIASFVPDVPAVGDAKTKEIAIEPSEVWAIDLIVSTGPGKPQRVDTPTTVFRRNPESTYKLKMKASRTLFSSITTNFPYFPFTLRALGVDEVKAKLGIVECEKHELVEAYPVLHEKAGEYVAHVKFTVLVHADKSAKITGLPFDMSNVKPDTFKEDDAVKSVLAMALPKKKANKKKKKNKK